MLLAIDVGNTNIVLGVYREKELKHHWRVASDRVPTEDELAVTIQGMFQFSGLKFDDITAIAIASVVPPMMFSLERLARKYFGVEPLVIGPGIRTGLVIRYDNPREVGADRIAAAIAAYETYGGPVIVVDFGTATTIDAVSAEGEYLGGAIAPGIGISTEALVSRAAKLPRIELNKPRTAIGKNTVASMQSGIIFGFVGQVDELARRIQAELGGKATIIATGGLAPLIASESRMIEKVDQWLVLEGLRIVYERNKGEHRGHEHVRGTGD